MHLTFEELDKKAKELYEKYGNRELTMKDRREIPLQEMPSQEPKVRACNMQEVALGYSENQVKVEAFRCLQCKGAPCVKGCPVGIDIPRFIKLAGEGKFIESANVINESSLLPAICGRVCPQESQCQKNCTVGKMKRDVDQSVAIGRIERFVADYKREHGKDEKFEIKETGKKVAIVGAGPAGITVANDVRKEGHEVVLFEALHKSGGVLVYGIPEFRLPKSIVEKEVNGLKKMGVKVNNNYLIGRTKTIDQLLEEEGFDAIFIGSGAGLPRFLNIPGENLIGVFSANEFLTRSNLMKAYDLKNSLTPMYNSKKVAVFGAGNVAMDAARTALRLGAEKVTVVYRRTEVEMPARKEEVAHAKEEGVIFQFLHSPLEIIGDENQKVTGVKLQKMELGEPDESGRRRPRPIKNSEFIEEFDTVVVSIGSDSNPLIRNTMPNIEFNKWGNFIVDEETCETNVKGIFAGGDAVSGAATVILAMGQGRQAAKAINEYLKNK